MSIASPPERSVPTYWIIALSEKESRGPYEKSLLERATRLTYGMAYSSSMAISCGRRIAPIRRASFFTALQAAEKELNYAPGIYRFAEGKLTKIGEWIPYHNLVRGVDWVEDKDGGKDRERTAFDYRSTPLS